jgi:hypothetical protein
LQTSQNFPPWIKEGKEEEEEEEEGEGEDEEEGEEDGDEETPEEEEKEDKETGTKEEEEDEDVKGEEEDDGSFNDGSWLIRLVLMFASTEDSASKRLPSKECKGTDEMVRITINRYYQHLKVIGWK